MFGSIAPTKSLLISLLEPAINQYLSLDDNYRNLLAPIAGKVIAIDISNLHQTLYLCPGENSLQILESYPDSVDARLSGSLSALGLMGLSATPMHSLFKGEVRIEGDALIAHKFQSLFAKLDLQLENKLARYTGASIAQHVSSPFSGVFVTQLLAAQTQTKPWHQNSQGIGRSGADLCQIRPDPVDP